MFARHAQKIKDFEVITYRHAPSGVALSVIPRFGALIQRLVLALTDRTFEVLDVPGAEEIPDNPIYKSSLLAPFPNRVDAGRYQFNGKEHQLPVNEKDRNNAIHGFICDLPFEISDERIEAETVALTLKNAYLGDFPGYPFPFETELRITLSTITGLECTCTFLNTGSTSMPFGFAWHPYFSLGARVDDLELQLPECREYEVTNRLIPTGVIKSFGDFRRLSKIGDRQMDKCLRIEDAGSTVETIIRNRAQNYAVRIWQEAGKDKLSHLVIYTPPGRRMLAIEPQSCNINAFNNGQGLIILERGKKAEARFGVSVTA